MMLYSSSSNGFYDRSIHGDRVPADVVEITGDYYEALLAGQSAGKRIVSESGYPVLQNPPVKTADQTIAQYESALDAHLDSVAILHRYDSRFTFALRAGYDGPYRSEATAFAQWMDLCNLQAYALLEEVVAGRVEQPSIEEFIDGLPVFVGIAP